MDSREKELKKLEMCIGALLEYEYSMPFMTYHKALNNSFSVEDLSRLSFTQLIDLIMSLTEPKYSCEYLINNPHEISYGGEETIQQIKIFIARNKYSLDRFNQTYYNHCLQLEQNWDSALKNNSIDYIFNDLEKQRDFLKDFYADYFDIHAINYFHLLAKLYGQHFSNYHYYCLKQFKPNYSAFMKRTQKNYCVKFNTHLFIKLNQSQRLLLYQALIDRLLPKSLQGKITCEFHSEKSKLFKKLNQEEYTIFLSDCLSFVEELDQVMMYLGEIFYEHALGLYESTFHHLCQASFEKEQFIAFFQFIPLACPKIRTFIAKSALKIDDKSTEASDKYEKELLNYYLNFHANPLREHIVNPLQRINLLYCEVAIEKGWFNQCFPTNLLPHYWEKLTQDTFKKVPHHIVEGSLRMKDWLAEKQGTPFIKLACITNLFSQKLVNGQSPSIFQDFEQHFIDQTITQWDYHQIFNKELSNEINPAQNTLLFLGKFYPGYIYRRPLTHDHY